MTCATRGQLQATKCWEVQQLLTLEAETRASATGASLRPQGSPPYIIQQIEGTNEVNISQRPAPDGADDATESGGGEGREPRGNDVDAEGLAEMRRGHRRAVTVFRNCLDSDMVPINGAWSVRRPHTQMHTRT